MHIFCYFSIFRIIYKENCQYALCCFYKLSTLLTVYPQIIALFLTKKSTATMCTVLFVEKLLIKVDCAEAFPPV